MRSSLLALALLYATAAHADGIRAEFGPLAPAVGLDVELQRNGTPIATAGGPAKWTPAAPGHYVVEIPLPTLTPGLAYGDWSASYCQNGVCDGRSTPLSVPTQTPSRTATPTSTPSASPTFSPTATITYTPTSSPTATPTLGVPVLFKVDVIP